MPLIEWTESFSVGSPQMDAQHKKLVNLTNRLHDAMKSGHGKDVVGAIVKELVDYTRTHFRDEERLLGSVNYAGLDEQMREHTEFMEKVNKFENDFRAGNIALSKQIIDFLRDWLVIHIQKSDKEYMPFVTKQSAKV